MSTTSIKSCIARRQLAIALVLAGIMTNTADVWITLQARIVESNPVVLSLGWDAWILVKAFSLLTFVGAWWIGRDHRYGTIAATGPLAVGLFGLIGNASASAWYETGLGRGALLFAGISLLIVFWGIFETNDVQVVSYNRKNLPSLLESP